MARDEWSNAVSPSNDEVYLNLNDYQYGRAQLQLLLQSSNGNLPWSIQL